MTVQKFVAKDVVYTTDLIKDPTVNSPYYETWKDIGVEALNDTTVVFPLKDQLATFPGSLQWALCLHTSKNML